MSGTIDRRDLFKRVGVVASAAMMPDWLVRGFAPQDGKDRVPELRAAEARARALGKVLTVFVVPTEPGADWPRGQEFGALLNHCGQHTLIDLAACEPCCGTVAEVRKAFEGMKVDEAPWMLCIARTGEDEHLVARTVTPDFSKLEAEPTYKEGDDWEKLQAAREAWMRSRIACMETALRREIESVRDTNTASAVPEATQKLIADIGDVDTPPDPKVVFRHGAFVHRAMDGEKDRKRRARLVTALVAASTEFYRNQRLPGSKWAHSGGCGLDIEGETKDGPSIARGMAMTPPLSSRFLYFFSG